MTLIEFKTKFNLTGSRRFIIWLKWKYKHGEIKEPKSDLSSHVRYAQDKMFYKPIRFPEIKGDPLFPTVDEGVEQASL